MFGFCFFFWLLELHDGVLTNSQEVLFFGEWVWFLLKETCKHCILEYMTIRCYVCQATYQSLVNSCFSQLNSCKIKFCPDSSLGPRILDWTQLSFHHPTTCKCQWTSSHVVAVHLIEEMLHSDLHGSPSGWLTWVTGTTICVGTCVGLGRHSV